VRSPAVVKDLNQAIMPYREGGTYPGVLSWRSTVVTVLISLYGGNIEKCRVMGTALSIKEHAKRAETSPCELVEMFVRHRAEIEGLALAKLWRRGQTGSGIVITSADLNP
jgi:hypothetical protein